MNHRTIVAVYRGSSMADMELVGVSADPGLARYVSRRLTRDYAEPRSDPALQPIQDGRLAALRVLSNQEGRVFCSDLPTELLDRVPK